MNFDLTLGIAVLERTPNVLRTMLGGLSPMWTDATEGPNTWSPYVVVGHLIQADRSNWIVRARQILDQNGPRRFTPFERVPTSTGPLDELLDELATIRAENLATLTAWHLTDEQLALQGEHAELGPVTLRQLLSTWAAHDLSHIAQIARVMAKQYREEIGPWRAYLPIMDR